MEGHQMPIDYENGKVTLTVRLNGTDENSWHKFGLTQNPFPQLAKMEYDRFTLHLAALDGDPIPDTDYIRNHLKGWDPEFVKLCCLKFKKGKRVTFIVEWPI
jgi:hypothetical protein